MTIPKTKNKKHYDVCIVGSGPAGLATLSALQEPYSRDTISDFQEAKASKFMKRSCRSRNSTNKKKKKNNSSNGGGPNYKDICIIDTHTNWLQSWNTNFHSLNIQYLRSPTMAHPDYFDSNSLLTYALSTQREHELIESGCFDNKKLLALGQTQIGLWKLPSSQLFYDFCVSLTNKLQHDYITNTVVDITKEQNGDEDESDDENTNKKKTNGIFHVKLGNDDVITADAVVLALGSIGRPVIPKHLQEVPSHKIISWKNMKQSLSSHSSSSCQDILVIGGGLTAVQAAQYALRLGKRVTLCSRRPLVQRHFDITNDWFDVRSSNRLVNDFYHQDVSERLKILKNARGGGSVPPIYMEDIKKWCKTGKLINITAEAQFIKMDDNNDQIIVSLIKNTTATTNGSTTTEGKAGGTTIVKSFDCIINACGITPDCLYNPLISNVYKNFPITIEGGYPCIDEDLEWTTNLFVVGGLASMNTGPDSANLMGIRRAAKIVANALECRTWLRNSNSRVLSNQYAELTWSSSSSDDDDD